MADLNKNQITYIVNFRTLPNGAYKWMRGGMRRGYWRVLAVPAGKAPTLSSRGVYEVMRTTDGIDGVTPRSRYYIGGQMRACKRTAARLNRAAYEARAAVAHNWSRSEYG